MDFFSKLGDFLFDSLGGFLIRVLNFLFELIKALLGGISKAISGILTGFNALLDGIVPITNFFGSVFGFLPGSIMLGISAIIMLYFVYWIIKLVRG